MQKIELLSPAGDMEKLKYAVLYGANAVYLGGEAFSLRTASENFGADELKEAVNYAHKNNVKVFVAVNIIPHNDDIESLPQYLELLKAANVDAVIVADLGAFSIAREVMPNTDIHISTQANITNWQTALKWHKMGAKRVVLARELTLYEIEEIRIKTPQTLELEAFIHGAMCMSYSGRCLISNYLTLRDSNRGNCAQSCRWKYNLVEEKRPNEFFPIMEDDGGTFIFNSKDLCMIDHIPELIKAGINSFKIEGRVKSAYYVATITKAYRDAIDEYYKGKDFDPIFYREIEKVSHREYCTGFFYGNPKEEGQQYGSNSYIREYDIIGVILDYDPQTKIATVEQRNKFFKGDKIEIMQPNKPFFEQTADYLKNERDQDIEVAPHSQMILKMKMAQDVVPDAMIRKEK